MAPSEVAGLQALARAHGGTLTTNPDTGLPEAGFLRAILPMVAGAGLTFISGGAINPLTAGLITGGVTGVATGSLKQGLMAGLGAYGGAGIGSVVSGAGAGAASNMAAAEAAAAGELAAQQAIIPSGIPAAPVTPVAPPVATAPVVPAEYASLSATPDNFGAFGEPPISATPAAPAASVTDPVTRMNMEVAQGAPTVMNSPAPAASTPYYPENVGGEYMRPTGPSYEQMRSAGLSDAQISQSARDYASNMKGFAQDPFSPATREAMSSPISTGIKAIADKPSLLFNKENLKYGAAAAAPLMFQEPEKGSGYQGSGPNPFQYEYDPNTQTYASTSSSSAERQYFDPRYRRLASGGISNLGDYSDGGRLLRGPGDGVSDSIPASIADKRPARLADGEFVVPARVVSELGNGSTEAGARKLYAMMDRIQKNRAKTIGKGKVAVNSRSEKLLPA
jgi:hypothetical protein